MLSVCHIFDVLVLKGLSLKTSRSQKIHPQIPTSCRLWEGAVRPQVGAVCLCLGRLHRDPGEFLSLLGFVVSLKVLNKSGFLFAKKIFNRMFKNMSKLSCITLRCFKIQCGWSSYGSDC